MATNTLPAPVRPANPAALQMTIMSTAEPHATLDAGRPWTADPRAAKLLASCATLPPVGKRHRSRYGNATDEWFAYVGYRAEALEAIRMEHGDCLLQAYHQHGESAYEPFRQWRGQPNATSAITAALASSTEA